MPSSTYKFAGATSPIVGDNGNPFGNIVFTHTINAEGLVVNAEGLDVHCPEPTVLTGYEHGYTFEIKFKTGAPPHAERRLFTLQSYPSYNYAVTIQRNGSVFHRNSTPFTLPHAFFLTDSVFHIYKFVYDGTNIEAFRDGVSLKKGPIGPPYTTDYANWLHIVGDLNRFGADAAPSDLTVEYAYVSIGSNITYTYAHPASDITKQWSPSTGTDHYATIDEATASDTDYIYATAAGQTDEVKLQAMTLPKANTDVAVNYRVQGVTGSASVTVSLLCGATVIATDTARTANGDYTLTVPYATWGSVTDWTDMRLRFVSA